MHRLQADPAGENCLRFVFSDTVVSFSVPPGVTLGEIADRFGEVSDRFTSEPVAVDVTLGTPMDGPVRWFAPKAAGMRRPRRGR